MKRHTALLKMKKKKSNKFSTPLSASEVSLQLQRTSYPDDPTHKHTTQNQNTEVISSNS